MAKLIYTDLTSIHIDDNIDLKITKDFTYCNFHNTKEYNSLPYLYCAVCDENNKIYDNCSINYEEKIKNYKIFLSKTQNSLQLSKNHFKQLILYRKNCLYDYNSNNPKLYEKNLNYDILIMLNYIYEIRNICNVDELNKFSLEMLETIETNKVLITLNNFEYNTSNYLTLINYIDEIKEMLEYCNNLETHFNSLNLKIKKNEKYVKTNFLIESIHFFKNDLRKNLI